VHRGNHGTAAITQPLPRRRLRPTKTLEGLSDPIMAPPSSAQLRHMATLVRDAIPPMHPGGRPVVAGVAGASLALRMLARLVGLRRTGSLIGRVGTAATVGSALFFRMPHRVPPSDVALVVAPADGLVSQIVQAAPPPETGLGDAPRTRVSIFLSLLDVHVQYAPVTGGVRSTHYHPGAFLSADLDKASDDNERNSLVIDPAAGGPDVVVTQIAGLLARRIVCDVAAGDAVHAGEVYGLIRFGSRLDTYLPAGATPLVRVGQRAVGGETALARLPGANDA
jgi:phosphatidylserine decarboxylase